ncbi:hypothetical protein [Streptomyces sp. MAI_2237]
MDGQWAVVVGAALGASGAVVGALTTWASARLQSRSHLDIARLQHESAQYVETIDRKRTACAELILSVDTVRRQMRVVRQQIEGADGSADVFHAKRLAVHDRIREMQAAEWVLRLMLSVDEQDSLSQLLDAVYVAHDALIHDGDEWLAQSLDGSGRPPGQTERFVSTTAPLQAQMMTFAQLVHSRLYLPALAVGDIPVQTPPSEPR